MGERHDAEHSVAQARGRVSAIAEELSRRSTAGHLKAKTRERSLEMKDRFIQSPLALGLIGGAVGSVAGKVISDRIRKSKGNGHARYGWQERYLAEDVPYDEYTATHPHEGRIITEDRMYGLDQHLGEGVPYSEGEGEQKEGVRARAEEKASEIKEKAGEFTERAKEKAGEFSERAKGAMSGARERMPSSAKEGAQTIKESAEEYAGLWTIGAMAVGAFFGAMVPVSRKERQMLAPAKAEVKEQLHSLKEEATDKVQQVRDAVEANVGLVSGSKSKQTSAAPAEPRLENTEGSWVPPHEPEPTRH